MSTVVYIFEHPDTVAPDCVDAMLRIVSPERRAKALECKNISHRAASLAAEMLLRNALSSEPWHLLNSISAPLPAIVVGEHGKPAFADASLPHFSLSHCRRAVACTVSSEPVGVDVEIIRPLRPATARAALSAKELTVVGDSAEEFTRLWTMKESLVKLTGRGIEISRLPELLTTPQALSTRFETVVSPSGIITTCAYTAGPLSINMIENIIGG